MKDKKDRYVRVCPRCGSTNIDWKLDGSAWSIALSGMGGAAVFDNFTCMECGYSSRIMPEFPESEVSKVQDDIKKKNSKE